MSMCSDPLCKSTKNIWTIKNTNTSPPFYQPFEICNKQLNKDHRFAQMREALVSARIAKQSNLTVQFDDWIFTKNISTWNKNDKSHGACLVCSRTDKLWRDFDWNRDSNGVPLKFPNHYLIMNTLCDDHLTRDTYRSIKPNSDRVGGVIEVEETWL